MFQRIALKEFMDLCDYETVSAENGRVALEELRKP